MLTMNHQTSTHVLCIILAAFTFANRARAEDATAVKITPEEKVVQITIDGKPFTTYHFADDVARPYVRPFFWPVVLGDGTEITSDQTQAAPGKNGKIDHPHHRSIWVALAAANPANHH